MAPTAGAGSDPSQEFHLDLPLGRWDPKHLGHPLLMFPDALTGSWVGSASVVLKPRSHREAGIPGSCLTSCTTMHTPETSTPPALQPRWAPAHVCPAAGPAVRASHPLQAAWAGSPDQHGPRHSLLAQPREAMGVLLAPLRWQGLCCMWTPGGY